MTWILKPCLFPSLAAASKKLVAVLNTPVMSGGVQPMTMGFCHRSPANPNGAAKISNKTAIDLKSLVNFILPPSRNLRDFLSTPIQMNFDRLNHHLLVTRRCFSVTFT